MVNGLRQAAKAFSFINLFAIPYMVCTIQSVHLSYFTVQSVDFRFLKFAFAEAALNWEWVLSKYTKVSILTTQHWTYFFLENIKNTLKL